MTGIGRYLRPSSIEDAQRLLDEDPRAVVMGGGVFLKLGSRRADTLIDLQDAGLRWIRDLGDQVSIGAMTTYRDIETSPLLASLFGGLLPATVANVVGVQLRNLVSVGGTVMGRYGFSELLTSLSVLRTSVVLHRAEPISLSAFLAHREPGRGILESILIEKEPLEARYHAIRNTAGSLPTLGVAMARAQDGWRVAAGSRPGVARSLTLQAEPGIRSGNGTLFDIHSSASSHAEFTRIAAAQMDFRDDMRASASWREAAFIALVNRMMTEMGGDAT